MNRLEATCSNLHHRTPTANLISKRVLSSLFSQLFICLGFQYSLYHFLVRQSWYLPIPFSAFSDNILGQLNTALFSFTVFQYVIVAFVFTNNQPHQRPVYTNLPFMLVACVVTLWNFVFLLFPSPRVATFMELVPLPFNFRLFLLAMVFLNCVVSFIADRGSLILLKWFLTHLKKIQLFQDYFLKHHAKNRKIYKKILSDLEPDPCRV